MTRAKLIVCLGLQRSGNHAVLGWVSGLFDNVQFHNDEHHDVLADATRAPEILPPDPAPGSVTIVSFEDSANRTKTPGVLLPDSVILPSEPETAAYEIHRLVILRDPYNTWASRVAANNRAEGFGRKLTSDPSWALFRENWLALAALDTTPGWTVIRFNRWKDDAEYRHEICAGLGGRYTEEMLGQVSHRGGGSSFDGTPRPSYLGMVRQYRKYLTPAFRQRLLSRPGYYLQRLTQPPAQAEKFKVDERWSTLTGRADSAALFTDTDLAARTEALFGSAALPPKL